MCGKNVYSSWLSTLKDNLIWQDLLVLLFLALHHTQLFLTEHSEAKLINVLQASSKDVRIPAVAKVGRLSILKDAGILSSEAVMFHDFFSIHTLNMCSIKSHYTVILTPVSYCLE